MSLDRFVNTVGRLLNALSASWMFLLAFVVLVDVIGRGAFDKPLVGTPEIIANSIVAVTFLQLPFAISAGAMIHTPIGLSLLPTNLQRIVETMIMASGVIVFATLAYASLDPMFSAWQTGEYFGEGALRVPTVYTRAVIVAMSAFSALAYLLLALEAARGRYSMLAGGQTNH